MFGMLSGPIDCLRLWMIKDFLHRFNGALLTAYLYLLYPIATFQKAGTCLDAQQSMAKQPIKGGYHDLPEWTFCVPKRT